MLFILSVQHLHHRGFENISTKILAFSFHAIRVMRTIMFCLYQSQTRCGFSVASQKVGPHDVFLYKKGPRKGQSVIRQSVCYILTDGHKATVFHTGLMFSCYMITQSANGPPKIMENR